MEKTGAGRKIVVVLLCILSFFLVMHKEEKETAVNHEKADMTEYNLQSHCYYESSVKDIIQMKDDKETFVVLFGYSDCDACQKAVPALLEAAEEKNVDTIYYINTRKKKSWTKNTDIDDYDLLVDWLEGYLSEDENGNPYLYVPYVLFVKDGVLKAVHTAGTDYTDEELTQVFLDDLSLIE